MKNIHLTLASLGMVLLVSGCGGGSSSSGGGVTIPTGTVQINAANATSVAAKGVNSGNVLNTAQSKGSVKSAAAGQAPSLADIAYAQFKRLQGKPINSTTKAIANATLTCAAGGTGVESYQDNNNNNTFDVGDVATLTYTNCVNGTVTENGSISISITKLNVTGTAPNQTIDASITMTFGNSTGNNYVHANTANTLTMNGDMTMAMYISSTSISFSMSGTRLSANSTIDGAFAITNYSFGIAVDPNTGKASSIAINMTTDCTTTCGGTIGIATTTPFSDVTSPTADPDKGVMRIQGAGGSYVELTAKSDGVHVGITYDEGKGAGKQPLSDTTWAAL